FFFSSRRRHTRFSRDWSSDVCSSDLGGFHTEDAKRNRARRMTAAAFDVDPELEGADGPAPASPVPVADDLRDAFTTAYFRSLGRSEERRVGTEWKARGPA